MVKDIIRGKPCRILVVLREQRSQEIALAFLKHTFLLLIELYGLDGDSIKEIHATRGNFGDDMAKEGVKLGKHPDEGTIA